MKISIKGKKMMTLTMISVLGIGILGMVRAKRISPLALGWHAPVLSFSGSAIGGFDPVAYFENQKPAPGQKDITTHWNNAVWRFSSVQNRDAFLENPQAYAPRFGGYCSFAISKGFTAKANPKAWAVHKGQLYLFSEDKFRAKWLDKVSPEFIQSCRAKWGKDA